MTRPEQALLPNPECFWKPQAGLGEATRADVESRIGAFAGPCTPLSGGLANANVLLDGRVLRIYRRNPHARSGCSSLASQLDVLPQGPVQE